MPRRKPSHKLNQNLPAHETKHLKHLAYTFKNSTFSLAQKDDGSTNGTALWMGAQVLTAWLSEHYGKKLRPKRSADGTMRRPRVVELGSGIGLTALALCSLGWDVLATDLPDVINSVLSQNITDNLPNLPANSGTIHVRVLDWNVPPPEWVWNYDTLVASAVRTPAEPSEQNGMHLVPPFDLIVSADTVYSSSLVDPLLRTLSHLCNISGVEVSSRTQWPPIHLCIERRDPGVIESLLETARDTYVIDQLPERVMLQAMEKNGLTWDKEDWDGLEIWSLARIAGGPEHIGV